MNENNFENRFYSSDHFEETDEKTINQEENSDSFADKTPRDEAQLHEAAMGGTVAAVGPMDHIVEDVIPLYGTHDREPLMGETVAAAGSMDHTVEDVIPKYQSPHQEVPMGGTVAAVGPMDGPADDVIPLFETPDQEIPMGGTVAAVGPMEKTISYETPVVEPNIAETPDFVVNAGSLTALLNQEQSAYFRTRWNKIQGNFVDEPRSSVQQADALVSEVIEQITQMFSSEHVTLESQWNQGNDVSTEDLRKALQHYRSFFNRLVL